MAAHKDSVQQFYDRIGRQYHDERYTSQRTSSSYGMLKRRDIVMRLIDSTCTDARKLLDVGCGPGSYTLDYVQRGYEVWGIDISAKMVEEANRMFIEEGGIQGVHFSQGDIEDLSFPADWFDVVVAAGVLEYLETDERAVGELYRVTKPHGIVIVTITNKGSFSGFVRALTLKPLRIILSASFPGRVSCADFRTRTHAPKEFISYMNSHGFSFVGGEFCDPSLLPYNLPVPKAYFRVSELLEKLLKPVGLDTLFAAYVGMFKKQGEAIEQRSL